VSLDEKAKLSEYVGNEELLFRGVPNQPSFIKEDGSITSAILKDSHGGVSVDRDGGRNDSDVITFFCKTQQDLGKSISYSKFLKMPVSIVRQNKCDVTAVPLDNNPYHAEITQNGSGELKRGDIKNIIKQSFVLDNPV
jgi:hypothetical protein